MLYVCSAIANRRLRKSFGASVLAVDAVSQSDRSRVLDRSCGEDRGQRTRLDAVVAMVLQFTFLSLCGLAFPALLIQLIEDFPCIDHWEKLAA
jgi:hypothetical protein